MGLHPLDNSESANMLEWGGGKRLIRTGSQMVIRHQNNSVTGVDYLEEER